VVYFVVLGLILLMGVAARRPSRASYVVVAIAAVGASVYEYFK
jgi:hypothetical protein